MNLGTAASRSYRLVIWQTWRGQSADARHLLKVHAKVNLIKTRKKLRYSAGYLVLFPSVWYLQTWPFWNALNRLNSRVWCGQWHVHCQRSVPHRIPRRMMTLWETLWTQPYLLLWKMFRSSPRKIWYVDPGAYVAIFGLLIWCCSCELIAWHSISPAANRLGISWDFWYTQSYCWQ